MSDISTWLTKQEAAARLGVNEKTIDRMAERGEIQKETRRNVGEAPRPVFDPADVNRLAEKKGIQVSNPDGQALVRQPVSMPRTPSDMDRLAVSFAEALRQGPLAEEPDSELPLSELRFKVYLTTAEAIRFSGLSEQQIRDAVREGNVKKAGTRRYRRADLEAL
jgi:DNA-binding transcriptional MerR regulator